MKKILAIILVITLFLAIFTACEKEEINELFSNVLSESQSGVLDNDMIRNPIYFDKNDITAIDFLDSLENAPEDAWDFSLAEDRRVLGWLDGTHLYVAGNGGVIADEDAYMLFGFDRYERLLEGIIQGGNLQEINFNGNFDTSNITSMSCMFSGCSAITTLDLSGFDTSNVLDMSDMFYACTSLTSLSLLGFTNSKVQSMEDMFSGCTSLISIDLSNFNTTKVVNLSGMFSRCTSLLSLDLSNFKTLNVLDMSYMFAGCDSLAYVNLSSFDTSNVTDMSCMFNGCSSLTMLDISNFDTSNATTNEMFTGTIYE